jgi:hypothetical protein
MDDLEECFQAGGALKRKTNPVPPSHSRCVHCGLAAYEPNPECRDHPNRTRGERERAGGSAPSLPPIDQSVLSEAPMDAAQTDAADTAALSFLNVALQPRGPMRALVTNTTNAEKMRVRLRAMNSGDLVVLGHLLRQIAPKHATALAIAIQCGDVRS